MWQLKREGLALVLGDETGLPCRGAFIEFQPSRVIHGIIGIGASGRFGKIYLHCGIDGRRGLATIRRHGYNNNDNRYGMSSIGS